MTTKTVRNRWIGSVALFALLPPAGAAGQVELTLEEALALALANHPTIVQARGNIRIAEASRREYIGDWLPSLTSSTSWSRNSQSRFDPTTQRNVSGSSTSASTSLNASYTIFDGFRRNAVGRSTRADIESAEANKVNQEFQIILQTKQAFFNAVAADELVRVSETRIQRAEEQLRISRDKLSAGSAIRSDTLRSLVELANGRLQLLNAQTQRETASANLARLVGADQPVRVVSDSLVLEPTLTIDTAALRQEALQLSPNVLQADAAVRAAGAQIGVSKAQYFPSVSTSLNTSWSGDQFTDLRNAWSVRFSLSWPLFNGFSREAGVARANASYDAAQAQLEDARRQLTAQLTQQFAALQSATIRFQIAQASQLAAEEDLRVQQQRYRLGASTILDVLASQVNLDQAAVDLVQARLDYFLARAEIEALVGREI